MEVLVATSLFLTAVVALAQLFVLAARANAAAGEMTVATVLAAQKVEELRAASLPTVLPGQSVDYLDSRGERLGSATSDGRRAYARRWSVERHRPGAAAGGAGVTVAVTVAVFGYRQGDGGLSGPVGSSGGAASGGAAPAGTVPEEIVRIVTLRTGAIP